VKLTKFSDYSLRLLIYLGVHPDRLVSVAEVSRAYHVSPHVVVKVVQLLVEQELVVSVQGRNGGLRLAKPPEAINVGRLIRQTEPGLDLVECFDQARNTCPIEPACGLKGALKRAQRAFFGVLDAHTLADFLPRAPTLIRLLSKDVRPREGSLAGGRT
jgi:Rrf2 family transcriptional regulator, nitric oxide-sensitive transcriptional repressor